MTIAFVCGVAFGLMIAAAVYLYVAARTLEKAATYEGSEISEEERQRQKEIERQLREMAEYR